jgi:hypothetical protein
MNTQVQRKVAANLAKDANFVFGQVGFRSEGDIVLGPSGVRTYCITDLKLYLHL